MSLLSAFQGLNPWAILVAGIVHMATGLIWYRPQLFGKAWVALTGQDLNPATRWLPLGAIGHLAVALALAVVLGLANATIPVGLLLGLIVWAGFVVTLEIGELIWEKIPFKLFLIRSGEHLVALSLAALILTAWR
jgi:hypothetical protein